MKITKRRMREILSEEVAAFLKQRDQNTLSIDEETLLEILEGEDSQLSDEEAEEIIDDEAEADAAASDSTLEEADIELEEKKDGRVVSAGGHKATKGTIEKLKTQSFQKVASDIAKSSGLGMEKAKKITGAALAVKKAKGIPHKGEQKEDKLLNPKTKEPEEPVNGTKAK